MPRSVLIVKLAAIGDVVMALPMITALREADPEVRITWMCGRQVAPLLERVEGIAELVVVDEGSMLAGSPWSKMRAVTDAWGELAGRRYDDVFIAHADTRYRVLAWFMRAGRRHWLGAARGRLRGMVPVRVHSDEYVRLVTGAAGYQPKRYPSPSVDASLPASFVRRIAAFNPDGRTLVAITPGGAKNVARDNPLRRWPLGRYAALADGLHARGYRVVLTGDRTDGWVRTAFFDRPVLDLIGATNIAHLAGVLARCAAVVAHDSGPLHVARLVRTPAVALLGPTSPTMFFRPDQYQHVLWPGGVLACAPCYDGRDFAPCRDNICMQMIEVETVLRHVTALVPSPTGRSAGDAERTEPAPP